MKKIIVLLAIFFYTMTLFGAYDVKLGVYKNVKNLRVNIAKIKSSKYRKIVRIEKKGDLHYAHAVVFSSKEARDALHAYTKVFGDAFIAKEQVEMKKKKLEKISKSNNKKSIKDQSLKKTIVKVKKLKNNINAYTLLHDKTVYMCYDKSPRHLKERVVKMVFSKNMVNYIPLGKNDTKLEIDYVFEDAKVTLNFQDINITHEIHAVKPKFLEVSNAMTGTETYTLRYYFEEKDALAFVTPEQP